MALAKLSFLLVAVVAQQYATTAPNTQPSSEELREQRGAERAMPYLISVVRTLIWSWAFLEGSVLFALSGYCPPPIARALLHALLPTSLTSQPSPTALDPLTLLDPTFLIGTLLTFAGTLLRGHCFHALGPRFTFELSIRPSHTLVTDGVYGVVRHPSYTGGLAIAMGVLLCMFDRQGLVVAVCMGSSGNGGRGADWDADERGHAMVTGVLACVWATTLGVLSLVLSGRMNKEDAMLEKHFGEQWRAWARRVPCRLVPGVY